MDSFVRKLFPGILNYIPISALAAVLVYTGYKLVDINAAKYILKLSKGEFAIYLITLVAILFTNLFEGIIIGFACAIIKSAYKVLKINIETEETQDTVTAKLYGNITFIQLPILIETLEQLPEDKKIILCVNKLHFIDHACIDYIKEWEADRKKHNHQVEINWLEMEKTYKSFKWKLFHKSDNSKPLH